MNLRHDPSVHYLQQSLALHRSLLSLIQTQKSEEEIIRLIVDSIYSHFPAYRCSFSHLTSDGQVRVIYSRHGEESVSISGKNFDASEITGLLEVFAQGGVNVVYDLRENLPMEKADGLIAKGVNPSRLDVRVRDFGGRACVLSLTHSKPVRWDPNTIELLREVMEPVGLLLREARAHEQLQRSEALFREFAENVQGVVWMTELPGYKLVYVSPNYEKIWGRNSAHLFENRLTLIDTIHPEDRARVENALRSQGREKYAQDYRVIRPDGEIRWIKDRGFLVLDDEGNPRRVIGIAEDVTPLREAEFRLEASQAQVISNAKFAALGEMASGIAHEINNPLAVIHGLAVQLQDAFHEGTAETRMVVDSLASMEKMSNRIATIVKGLRTFSRTSEGDPMIEADLVSIVQDTIAMCGARLRASAIDLQSSLPHGSASVECRSSEISQVVLNLVNNAIDAVEGRAERWIRVMVVAKPNRLRLVVEDSGPGVSEKARDRIFQPFFTTKEVGKGTGLGLSISKGIVEAHGGVLFLDSDPKITRFVVEIPRKSYE